MLFEVHLSCKRVKKCFLVREKYADHNLFLTKRFIYLLKSFSMKIIILESIGMILHSIVNNNRIALIFSNSYCTRHKTSKRKNCNAYSRKYIRSFSFSLTGLGPTTIRINIVINNKRHMFLCIIELVWHFNILTYFSYLFRMYYLNHIKNLQIKNYMLKYISSKVQVKTPS